MAGFAVNLRYLLAHPSASFATEVKIGHQVHLPAEVCPPVGGGAPGRQQGAGVAHTDRGAAAQCRGEVSQKVWPLVGQRCANDVAT